MKILLINPITRAKNVSLDRRGVNYPMGVGYVGAYLEQQGHQVTVLDNNQKCYNKVQLRDYLNDIDIDVVGISSMANTYNHVIQLCKLIKDVKGCPIVMGGALPTYSSKVVLENFDVDVCVLGEGEETAAELFDSWPNISHVHGIAYLDDNGNYIETSLRLPEKSRDDYPYPGYDGLLDITKYWRGGHYAWASKITDPRIMKVVNKLNENRELKIGTLLSGMGCPYQCTFCTNSTAFMRTRERTPKNVAKEALHLKQKYGVDAVRFDDDLLILQKQRTMAIAKEMKKTGVFWSGQAVGRSVADEEMIKELADSNCVGFGIGIESGSDRLLKAMMKGSRTHHYKKAYELALKYNLGIKVQVIYGVPGEDRSTLSETVEFFKETGMPPRRFNKLFPMPGSKIYDQCVEQGIIYNEHDYLNCASRVSGYTSKSFNFNVTTMSDDEYVANLTWAEKAMEDNYRRRLYRDPSFWSSKTKHWLSPHNLGYYALRIFMVTPVLMRVLRIGAHLRNRLLKRILLEKNIGPSEEDTMNSVNTIYPRMIPDMAKRGFRNRQLVDQRIEDIMRGNSDNEKLTTGQKRETRDVAYSS